MKLEFAQLVKDYGKKRALDHFSATLTGGVVGLLGENGAGKTTLLNMLVGLLAPTAGSIQLDGQTPAQWGVRYYDQIGYLPQAPRFYPNFTVLEIMRYIGKLKGLRGQKLHQRIDELLVFVNLQDDRRKKVSALSGGMRQRLGIAQALLNDPRILVLDEPTAGLDPRERIRFRGLIARLSADRLVILATHIVPDIEYIANEVLLLQRGRLISHASPQQLMQTLNGQVWQVSVPHAEVEAFLQRYKVGSLSHQASGTQMRVISPEQPHPMADPVEPNLEDVYLHRLSNEETV